MCRIREVKGLMYRSYTQAIAETRLKSNLMNFNILYAAADLELINYFHLSQGTYLLRLSVNVDI